MMIRQMTLQEICENREEIESYLYPVLDKVPGSFDIEDTFAYLYDGSLEAWQIVEEGKVISLFLFYTELNQGKKTAHIKCLSGENVQKIIENLPSLMEIALDRGCEYFYMMGRRGWKKFLQPHGFNDTLNVYVAKLN